MDFKPIELQDKPWFDRAFRRREYENSWFNFTNLFIWRANYKAAWTWVDDTLFVRLQANGMTYYLPPFSATEEAFVTGVELLAQESRNRRQPFLVKGLSPLMVESLGRYSQEAFVVEAQRHYYDYVYQTLDLRELAGRKYHAKRNHVNRFRQTYPDWSFELLQDASIEDCQQVAKIWCQFRECEENVSLTQEALAISEALTHFAALGLRGGLIRLAGQPVAFSFGEFLNSNTVVVHMEKADPSVNGLFAVINQECCRQVWADAEFVNREEDMGEAGLRKAKESYYPVRLVEKFKITLKEE